MHRAQTPPQDIRFPGVSTTQGGVVETVETRDPTPDARPWSDWSGYRRLRSELLAETRLNPGTATWTAPCVHGRRDVTWFRSQLTPADHEDCRCTED